jgi:hypothetical protein
MTKMHVPYIPMLISVVCIVNDTVYYEREGRQRPGTRPRANVPAKCPHQAGVCTENYCGVKQLAPRALLLLPVSAHKVYKNATLNKTFFLYYDLQVFARKISVVLGQG